MMSSYEQSGGERDAAPETPHREQSVERGGISSPEEKRAEVERIATEAAEQDQAMCTRLEKADLPPEKRESILAWFRDRQRDCLKCLRQGAVALAVGVGTPALAQADMSTAEASGPVTAELVVPKTGAQAGEQEGQARQGGGESPSLELEAKGAPRMYPDELYAKPTAEVSPPEPEPRVTGETGNEEGANKDTGEDTEEPTPEDTPPDTAVTPNKYSSNVEVPVIDKETQETLNRLVAAVMKSNGEMNPEVLTEIKNLLVATSGTVTDTVAERYVPGYGGLKKIIEALRGEEVGGKELKGFNQVNHFVRGVFALVLDWATLGRGGQVLRILSRGNKAVDVADQLATTIQWSGLLMTIQENPQDMPAILKKFDEILKNPHVVKQAKQAVEGGMREAYTSVAGEDRDLEALSEAEPLKSAQQAVETER